MSAVKTVPPAAAVETPLQRFSRDFFRSRIATAGFIGLLLIVIAALFAPVLAPPEP